jgi:uncharacterized membrane protein
MLQIVAFPVPDREAAAAAVDRLGRVARDTAVVFTAAEGTVRLEQRSDLTAARGAVRGGLLGAAVSIFAGAHLHAADVRGAAGAAYEALRDTGVNDRLMRLAGEQLGSGRAAVFLIAEDDHAAAVESAVRSSGVCQVEIGELAQEATDIVTEALRRS